MKVNVLIAPLSGSNSSRLKLNLTVVLPVDYLLVHHVSGRGAMELY